MTLQEKLLIQALKKERHGSDHISALFAFAMHKLGGVLVFHKQEFLDVLADCDGWDLVEGTDQFVLKLKIRHDA